MEAIQIDKWQELAISWGTKAIFAILILIIGHWLAKFIARMVIRAMEKQGVDVTLTRFFRAVIYYILLVAVVVAAAGSLGVNTGSFLAILGTPGTIYFWLRWWWRRPAAWESTPVHFLPFSVPWGWQSASP
jgi:small-conductance mechanosensitive channel